MQRDLAKLKKIMYTALADEIAELLPDKEYEKQVKNTWVILPAGGRGMRLRQITGSDVNKNALLINDTLTIIERIVLMYRGAGIKNFLVLVYHGADSVKDVLGDGSKFGVNIRYSYDPDKPVGRGGAILNALEKELLPQDVFSICHNPVDQIIDYKNFVRDLLSFHYYNFNHKNSLASIVVTKETPYPFTGMKIQEGFVSDISMYPMIPVPAHIGVTVFSPDVYEYFYDLFSLEEKMDFEAYLFPVLSKDHKLTAMGIDYKHWIPVKTNKHLETLRKKLNKNMVDGVIHSNEDFCALFVDGGARGNPGPAGIGGVLYDMSYNEIKKFQEYIGKATNNQAEYKALLRGLEMAKEMKVKKIKINMDSELVVKQILGEYKVKNEVLAEIFKQVKKLLESFATWQIRHIKREYNKEADSLVNLVIDKATKK